MDDILVRRVPMKRMPCCLLLVKEEEGNAISTELIKLRWP